MDTLKSILSVAGSGMRAQGERLKVVSENVANANSTGMAPGAATWLFCFTSATSSSHAAYDVLIV